MANSLPDYKGHIDPDDPPYAVLRDLLTAAFNPKTLRRFCENRPTFRPIRRELAPDHGLNDMIDRLFDYCGRELLWDELVQEVRQAHPKQFARFEPGLFGGKQKDRQEPLDPGIVTKEPVLPGFGEERQIRPLEPPVKPPVLHHGSLEQLLIYIAERVRWLWLAYLLWLALTALGFVADLGAVFGWTECQQLVLWCVLSFLGGAAILGFSAVPAIRERYPSWDRWATAVLWIVTTTLLSVFAYLRCNNLALFAEKVPVVQEFRVHRDDGSIVDFTRGGVFEIPGGAQWKVEAIVPDQSGITCTWFSDEGTELPADNCTVSFRPPSGRNRAALGVKVESRRKTRQTFTGLHVLVVPTER